MLNRDNELGTVCEKMIDNAGRIEGSADKRIDFHQDLMRDKCGTGDARFDSISPVQVSKCDFPVSLNFRPRNGTNSSVVGHFR